MQRSPRSDAPADAIAWGDSRMGRQLAEHDWGQSILGEPSSWPVSLRTALRIVLASQRPQAVWWGSDLAQLFNDRFREQFANSRRLEVALPAEQSWADLWNAAADRIATVITGSHDWHAPIAIDGVEGKDGVGAITLLPLVDDDGQPTGFLCEWSTRAPAPRMEDANLEERELRYRLVAEATGDYIWDWDLATDRVVRNAGVETLFGYGPHEIGDELSWGVDRFAPKARYAVML